MTKTNLLFLPTYPLFNYLCILQRVFYSSVTKAHLSIFNKAPSPQMDYNDYNTSIVSSDPEVTNPFSSTAQRNFRPSDQHNDRSTNTGNNRSNNNDTKGVQPRNILRRNIGFLNFVYDKRFQIALGIILILVATYLTVSSISYLNTAPEDQSEVLGNSIDNIVADPESQISNIGGPAGAVTSHYLITLGLGVGAFPLLIWMILCGISLFGLRKCQFWSMTFKALLFAITLSLSVGFVTHSLDITIPLGGFHGRYINTWLMDRIGWIGTAFVSLLFIGLVIAVYFYDLLKIYQVYRNRINSIKERMRLAREAREAEIRNVNNAMKASDLGSAAETPIAKPVDTSIDLFEDTPQQDIPTQNQHKDISSINGASDTTNLPEDNIPDDKNDQESPTLTPINGTEHPNLPGTDKSEISKTIKEPKEESNQPKEPDIKVNIPDKIEQVEYGRIGSTYDPTAELSHFRMPILDLLEDRPVRTDVVDITEISDKKSQIIYALDKLNIGVAHIDAIVGPTITMYEIIPVEGVKIATIKRLEEDIAMALSAISTRIIAPIPGKGAIGIEVPNREPQSVAIRTILGSRKFQECDYELPLALGATINNDVYISDLTKMPHLLVAGATGKGKSVGMNVIINSLIFKKHPAELKFVLIDPKSVEFFPYRKLEKHYLAKLPDEEDAIVTDMSKVVDTLKSLCIEMDNRYKLLMEAEVVKITQYNKLFTERKLNPEKGHRYLPYIVVIIDEYADLIMTEGKEVETPVARIAQKARAVGIHMIIATQRPSANIITGVIRANFPARIAFQVSNRIDSKIILDNNGAASLIGNGDMLISQDSNVERVQCAFIDTPEIKAVASYIEQQVGYPNPYMLPPIEAAGAQGSSGARGGIYGERDPLFNEIARDIVSSGVASTTGLQRRYSIGFARAGKIMDQLEASGIVGPTVGGKMRDILVDTFRLEEILSGLN